MEGIDDRRGQILSVHTEDDLTKGLKKAAKVLFSGGSVAFPTESFYGLAVNAMDEKAVLRLFSIKTRDNNNPVLILLPSPDSLCKYVETIPAIASELIHEFWPGALTIVFKAARSIPPLLTAGTGKIGIRLSSHPVATSLAMSIDGPITGTSANTSGRPACVTAVEVHNDLGENVDLILDGGRTEGGNGSTILDVTTNPPLILREGMICRDKLNELSVNIRVQKARI